MDKQTLALKIWKSADEMRASQIEISEYKDYILGLLFYKFLSQKQLIFAEEKKFDEDQLKSDSKRYTMTRNYFIEINGYFIEHADLFSSWIKNILDFNVSNVRNGIKNFNESIKNSPNEVLFDKIFNSLENGLVRLGAGAQEQTKALRCLINLIDEIPIDNKQDYDVLGFVYEYLVSQFATNAGKKAGEFYTPHEVSLLMSEIVAEHLKNQKYIDIYDPTSGSGSLLMNIGFSISKRNNNKINIRYFAQEIKESTYSLTRMNLIMRNILPSNIKVKNADSLNKDWPLDDNEEPLLVDAVVSNPPYSQKWNPDDKGDDPRFKKYGLAPKSRADYAFLLHCLFHLKNSGIMTIVLPHGVLFRSGTEETIRTNLIEENKIDAIIGLPPNVFFGTSIPTIIIVLKHNRVDDSDILIIDASKGFEKKGNKNVLRACDIKKIVDVVISRQNIEKFSINVSRKQIREENGYNLNIPRYVDSSVPPESFDILATVMGGIPKKEIDDFHEHWNLFPSLKKELFLDSNSQHTNLKISEDLIKKVIFENFEVVNFFDNYNKVFSDFNEYLYDNLISKIDSQQEIKISEKDVWNNIFYRLEKTKLVDKYELYQIFDNYWKNIEKDLEIIKNEGFETTRKVVENSESKNTKKNNSKNEYVGYIIPLNLIYSVFLGDKLDELEAINLDIEDINMEITKIADSFSTEDKESNPNLFDSENNYECIWSEIEKEVKSLCKQKLNWPKDSFESLLIEIGKLQKSKKVKNKEIKIKNNELYSSSIKILESLSAEKIKKLLAIKWINPLYSNILNLAELVIESFANKILNLHKKYANPLLKIEKDLIEAENQFAALIDELGGDESDIEGLKEIQKEFKNEK